MTCPKSYTAEPITSASTSSLYCPETAQLYAQFSASLNRRSESRLGRGTSSAHSYPAAKAPVRERSLLMPGAEGKLLVPDVKLPVYTGSSASLSTSRSKSRRSESDKSEDYATPKRPGVECKCTDHSPTLTVRSSFGSSSLVVVRQCPHLSGDAAASQEGEAYCDGDRRWRHRRTRNRGRSRAAP